MIRHRQSCWGRPWHSGWAHLQMAAALAIAAFVIGCASSPPMRFYTLSAAGEAEGSAARAIRVGRVKIPGEIDRSELVQRIDANRVRIAEQDRWAAPLEDMIRRTLSADLASATGEPATLAVEVEELIGDATCAVTLRASWELSAEGSGSGRASALSRGNAQIHVPGPGSSACSISALPAAMSTALAQLSERIVAARR